MTVVEETTIAPANPTSEPEWGGFTVKDFWQFAFERERVRCVRATGAARPWTSDPVIADRFFTNCFREDDPGTAISVEIMAHPASDAERLWNLLLYRRFNREDTWRDCIGYVPWDGEFTSRGQALFQRLEERDRGPLPLFTDAHQVYPLVQFASRSERLLRRVIAASWEVDLAASTGLTERLRASADMKDAFKIVKGAKLPGIAGFLAWQLCLDMRYGRDPILAHSDDEWAPVQAGCRVGLTLYANWPRKGIVGSGEQEGLEKLPTIPIPECEALMVRMRNRQRHEFAARGLDFRSVSGGRDMTISSLEHTLCECQKYWGVARGMPHSKRAFK